MAMKYSIHNQDCRDAMDALAENSIDAIVCDPPYGLSFMGKDWDHGVPGVEFWQKALRIAKPGCHLVAFSGTRTYHRLACAIEDAGWEIRDQIAWCYGSGFPKSLNVSKAIDKAAGAEREIVGLKKLNERDKVAYTPKAKSHFGCSNRDGESDERFITAPATDAAKQWDGWGTALKPAWEPIVLARKPIEKGLTVAQNVMKWGCGALNIEISRIKTDEKLTVNRLEKWSGFGEEKKPDYETVENNAGRWPANFCHDGSDDVVAMFPSTWTGTERESGIGNGNSIFAGKNRIGFSIGDSGSAARFFYCAKASKHDRDEGCEALPMKSAGEATDRSEGSEGLNSPRAGAGRTTGARNIHPTVKPTALMQWLCNMITPPNGTIIDPFMGSGSTGKAAMLSGFNFMGCDLSADYCEIARARIEHAKNEVANACPLFADRY